MKQEPCEMRVTAIKNGTVIDHIPSEVTFKVFNILKLKEVGDIGVVAFNLKSRKVGKKGIIKISDKKLSKDEIAKIALIAPQCTLSTIENYKVKEKTVIEVPDTVVGVGYCINPKCITNIEKVVNKFHIISKKPIKIRCNYCETVMNKDNIILK